MDEPTNVVGKAAIETFVSPFSPEQDALDMPSEKKALHLPIQDTNTSACAQWQWQGKQML
jgi:hypothetical protein